MSHNEPDDNEHFADAVSIQEGKAASRRRIFDSDSLLFRGSFVAMALGAVWGVAIAFNSFKTGQENTRADVDNLRMEDKAIRDEIAVLRRKVLFIREGDLWADSLRFQNGGKVVVPKPSDFKIEQ